MAAVVLPARMPVADHGEQERQLPMFDELVHTLADIAAAARETAIMQRQTQELLGRQLARLKVLDQSESSAAADARERHSHPLNPKWNTWRGFVLDLQRMERLVGKHRRVTKSAVAEKGPDSVKTITRAMLGYGLEANQWPPSTWNPDEERIYRPPSGQI